MGWEEIIEYGRRGDHRQGNGLWYVIIYLTAKETHIFNIHFIPETLIKFYPK